MRRNSWICVAVLFVSALSWGADALPAKKKKKLSLHELLNAAGASSNSSPAVAGVRGLEETGATLDTKARDFAAIERLEHVVVHEGELKKFVDEGKLR